MDVVRCLSTCGVHMPLVKAHGDLQAALAAPPQIPIGCGGFNRFDSRVDGRVPAGFPLGKIRDQSPTKSRPLAHAVYIADDRYLLGGRNVVTGRELPLSAHEIKLALDRGLVG